MFIHSIAKNKRFDYYAVLKTDEKPLHLIVKELKIIYNNFGSNHPQYFGNHLHKGQIL